jgi:2-methylcitrate dehydratase PrpD
VEAAIHLRAQAKPDAVREIEVKTYDLAVSGHDHTVIPGSYSAKMSIPYATAVGFLYGRAGLQEFSEEAVRDTEILALTGKVRVSADDALSAVFPGIQAAVVTVRTADGEYSDRVDFPKGEPENPLTDAEFRARYDGLMSYAGVDPAAGAAVFDSVYSGNKTVNELVKRL